MPRHRSEPPFVWKREAGAFTGSRIPGDRMSCSARRRARGEESVGMHAWHDIYVDDHLIEKAFPVVIEVPMGSKNKYELDKETGPAEARPGALQRRALSRQLRLHPPHVLRRRRPARRAGARPGGRGARSRSSRPAPSASCACATRRGSTTRSSRSACSDPAFADYTDHTQLPGYLLREIRRFFEDYKILEHKQVVVEDFMGPTDAFRIVAEALDMYRRLRRGEITKS